MSYNGQSPAVDGVNLEVGSGELMVLLGPSGSGKTTTLRLIAGLMQPTTGDVLFDGKTVIGVPPDKRGAVMVFQEDALFPFRTVAENLAFGLRMRKVDRRVHPDRIADALGAVHMTGFEDRWPDELSGGQRQRVALARSLVVRPSVLLLDEPLSNLEPALRLDLRLTIARVQRESNITTVLVTHDQAEAVALADRIALMIDGRIRQLGTPAEFFARPADAAVARFFGAGNFLTGHKTGSLVATAIGTLLLADAAADDGPVLLTIRPEAIEMAQRSENSFTATVSTSRFGGVVAECMAVIGETQLRFSAPAPQRPSAGDVVTLHLPPASIRVLPTGEDV